MSNDTTTAIEIANRLDFRPCHSGGGIVLAREIGQVRLLVTDEDGADLPTLGEGVAIGLYDADNANEFRGGQRLAAPSAAEFRDAIAAAVARAQHIDTRLRAGLPVERV